MDPTPLRPVPGVCEVSLVRGVEAPRDAWPQVVLEVPHGATRASDFEALHRKLRGPFPKDLRDFFFVNTDVGAPEVAQALATWLAADDPGLTVVVLRCLLPRTFVDCNRVIEPGALGAASAAGQVTPGLPPYVRDPDDLRTLHEAYAAYRALSTRAIDTTCEAGGTAVLVHTYAPRSLDVSVDDRIVEKLRREYAPGRIEGWPLRSEVDLITRTSDGDRKVSEDLVRRVREAFALDGLSCGEDATYRLAAGTMGLFHAEHHPRRTLSIEFRRDLLVGTFEPFRELAVEASRADRMGRVLGSALAAWRRAGSP